MFSNSLWGWVIFNLLVLALLVLDLGVLHRRSRTVGIRESLLGMAFWLALALLFNLGVLHYSGGARALEFFTGYLIELSLSVDNLFVFLLIFSFFRVPADYQHKVLFWGILGAIVMRGLFILTGKALLDHFEWIIYLFGAFLVYTGVQMARGKSDDVDPERNWAVRSFVRFFPFTRGYDGNRFLTRLDGRRMATPLLLVLLCVETTDVLFAMDSIPAIFGITKNVFIIYTSNVFAVLGLRSIYFALAGLMRLFHYLHYGLSAVLVFIGVKMLVAYWYDLPVLIALCVVAGLLGASVAASLLWPKKEDPAPEAGEKEGSGAS